MRNKKKDKLSIRSNRAAVSQLQGYVSHYDVLEELSNAICGLSFGYLLRGEADEAKEIIRRLIVKNAGASVSMVTQIKDLEKDETPDRLLWLPKVRVYSKEAWAFLDSEAVRT